MKEKCEICTHKYISEIVNGLVAIDTKNWNGKERRQKERRKKIYETKNNPSMESKKT